MRGIAFLTGGGARVVLRDGGHPGRRARGPRQPPQHPRGGTCARGRRMTALCGLAQSLPAAAAGALWRRHRRGRWHTAFHLDSRRQVPARPPADGTHDLRPRRLPRRVARLVCGGRGGRARRLARGLSGARHSGRGRGADRVAHGARAAPRSARCALRTPPRAARLPRRCASSSTQRSAVHLLVGGSVATFWSWGLMWWTPAFLQRSHHLRVGAGGATPRAHASDRRHRRHACSRDGSWRGAPPPIRAT